jgi:hypothetical protein
MSFLCGDPEVGDLWTDSENIYLVLSREIKDWYVFDDELEDEGSQWRVLCLEDGLTMLFTKTGSGSQTGSRESCARHRQHG